MADRAILHLDMDTFFVSVERRRDPSLVGKPVVVGGSPEGRGVVASASYESRPYGIHAAMPMAEALRRCPHLTVVRGGFGDYVKVSRQVRAILERMVPVVEQ
ncbi:MAG TPA: DNA polymerase IV, partial [bacterium]|nr:DNA polymerase IV [bacterium]